MNSHKNIGHGTSSRTSFCATATLEGSPPQGAELASVLVAGTTIDGSDATIYSSNDSSSRTATGDTTHLAAHADLVRYVRATLRRYGVTAQDMADAVAEVQTDAIEAARTRRMPASLGEWRALATTIAARWAVDRLRAAEVQGKYGARLCAEVDAEARPTLHGEHRDPVDTKRHLAVLQGLFDSGEFPPQWAEILWGIAEKVPHADIAEEIGIPRTVVDNRLSRMRARFRRRLTALGMLTLVILILAALFPEPVGRVARRALRQAPASEKIAPFPIK